MATKLFRAASFVFLGVSLACVTNVSEAQLSFATGDESEVSDDGLHRLESGQITGAWAKPDLDLSGYSKLYFQPAGVAFRDIAEARADLANQRSDDIYAVPEIRQAQLRELFAQSLHEAIGDLDGFTLTTEVGRDVLLVRGTLLDFISAVPPDSVGGQAVSVRWVYEAALVIELRDSMSDEILARTMERQRADGPVELNNVPALTPRLFSNWARRLARGVEVLSELAR
jgi:hypothetical protein